MMALTIPVPEEAKKALARVDEMHDNLNEIRQLLAQLVRIEEARIAVEGITLLDVREQIEAFHSLKRSAAC